jgi:cytochrome c biogenesis protein
MSKKKNSIWMLFASVKLTLFILFVLAAASIIGTILPQDATSQHYQQFYSAILNDLGMYSAQTVAVMTKTTFLLSFNDMYRSWWFNGMLGMLSLNLIICSIERLPSVWRLVVMDNHQTKISRLESMQNKIILTSTESLKQTSTSLKQLLASIGWPASQSTKDGGILLFSQKTPWTRLGVYVVHFSILVILAGAAVGFLYGKKGGLNLPETLSSNIIYEYGSAEEIDLGFTVKCNWFHMSRYPSGAPKEYQSELVILEDGKEVLTKIIEVNDPLTYKGWTFYQSSFQAHKKYIIFVQNKATGTGERFLVPLREPVRWQDENLLFAIKDLVPTRIPMTYQYELMISDGHGGQQTLILNDNMPTTLNRADDTNYIFQIKEFYSTGLQVAKDPGVWLVYVGCGLMLAGLGVAFFMSHRRLWLYIHKQDGTTTILVSGSANKNKPGFSHDFEKISEALLNSPSIKVQK